MKGPWRFPSPRTFFGLDDAYIQSVYEQFFLLKYHGGWSFIEAYNLPIKIRSWLLQRLADQIETRAAFDARIIDLYGSGTTGTTSPRRRRAQAVVAQARAAQARASF